jgi:hypothetical protein
VIFIELTVKTGTKAGLLLQLKKASLILSAEATGVCIPTGNTKMFLAAVYKSSLWSERHHGAIRF